MLATRSTFLFFHTSLMSKNSFLIFSSISSGCFLLQVFFSFGGIKMKIKLQTMSKRFNYRAVGKARVRKRRAKEKSATVENGDAVVFYPGAWNEREWEHELREAGEWTTLWRESRPMPVSAARLVSQPLSGKLDRENRKTTRNRARRLRSRHFTRFIYRPSRRSRAIFDNMPRTWMIHVWTIVNVFFLRNSSNVDPRFCTLISLSETICMKFVRESTIEVRLLPALSFLRETQ